MSDMSFKGWLIQLKVTRVEVLATHEISRQRSTHHHIFLMPYPFKRIAMMTMIYIYIIIYIYMLHLAIWRRRCQNLKLTQQNPASLSDYIITRWKLPESNGFIPPKNAQKPAHSVEQQASSHLLMDVARMLLGFLLVGFLISWKTP